MLRSAAAAVLLVALPLAGCDRAAPPTGEAAPAEAAWRAPPRVDGVSVAAGRITLTGRAQPGGRVVMRDGAGQAHAATAGPDGGFELTLPTSLQAVLLRPEDQEGQRAMPGPDVVLVLPGGAALALSPGAASRRLDGGTGLSAVDFDGRMVLVSGRKGRDGARVRLGGGAEMEVQVDAAGVWTLRTDVSGLGGSIVVDGVEHAPVLARVAPGTVSAAGDGVLIGWAAPDGAELATWIPAR